MTPTKDFNRLLRPQKKRIEYTTVVTSVNEVHGGGGRQVLSSKEFSGWHPKASAQNDSALEHHPDLQHGASGGQLDVPSL